MRISTGDALNSVTSLHGVSVPPIVSSPARGGLDAYELRLVAERRSQGRGWNNIAEILGRCVHDVRRACDPTYVAANAVRAVAGKIERRRAHPGLDLRRQDIRLIHAMAGKSWLARELAEQLDMGQQKCSAALKRLRCLGLADPAILVSVAGSWSTSTWSLTALGRRPLGSEDLAQLTAPEAASGVSRIGRSPFPNSIAARVLMKSSRDWRRTRDLCAVLDTDISNISTAMCLLERLELAESRKDGSTRFKLWRLNKAGLAEQALRRDRGDPA